MENCDRQSEYENELTKVKERTEILTILISNKFKEGESDIEGINNLHRVINDAMNDWIASKMTQSIENERNEVMNRNQNWVEGKRIIGVRKKRAQFFIRVKTTARFYELKSSVLDKFLKEELYTNTKNAKMKHVKRSGILIGVCVPFALKEWCQSEIDRFIEEEEGNIEIKIENMCQQEHSRIALVVYATMDKEVEISAKLIIVHNENELRIKCV